MVKKKFMTFFYEIAPANFRFAHRELYYYITIKLLLTLKIPLLTLKIPTSKNSSRARRLGAVGGQQVVSERSECDRTATQPVAKGPRNVP